MNELPFFTDAGLFIESLKKLHADRETGKQRFKRLSLTTEQRKRILNKTDNKCHICGIPLTEKFEADHVKSHSSGGGHLEENYLPACRVCNNYRWNYSWEEMQWILKIGVWAKTQMETKTRAGKFIAEEFVAHEMKREKRRKTSRFLST